jgi:hypothetical protein
MEVRCAGCGATLDVNPNLAGTRISCPSCGAGVAVPEPLPTAPRRRAEAAPAAPPPRIPRPEPYSAWLFSAQAALAALGAACLVGALGKGDWPPWSFLETNPFALVGVGVGFLVLAGVARRLPVSTTLLAACLVLAACALHYREEREVDASRVLALGTAMLALWLALQHRRAAR